MLQDETLIHEAAGAKSVVRRKSLIEQASSLAERWWTLPASDRCAILNALVERIDVHPKNVNLTVRITVIPEIVKPDLDVRQLASNLGGPTKLLSVAARLKRTGMETRLLVQGPLGPENRKADRSLLRLFGQAHRYHNTLLKGCDKTMAEIASDAGVSSSYFTRVLRLNFLPPEITRMILQGRQPHELTAKRIMTQGRLSPLWAKQKTQLDLA